MWPFKEFCFISEVTYFVPSARPCQMLERDKETSSFVWPKAVWPLLVIIPQLSFQVSLLSSPGQSGNWKPQYIKKKKNKTELKKRGSVFSTIKLAQETYFYVCQKGK